MCGFANLISFKKVDDEQINYVENFIRTEMLDILSTDANYSFGGDCDAIIDHEKMVQHFGTRFASDPSKFKFERGDRMLIMELVNFVKKEADSSNIHRFRMKKKKTRQRTRNVSKKSALECVESNGNKSNKMRVNSESGHATDIEFQLTLKTGLFEKVKDCLDSYEIDTNDFREEMIQLDFVDNNIYGIIQCAVCKQSGKKSKPKRVSYYMSPDSSYWVLSNFPKHLEKVHSLVATKPANQKKKARNRSKSKNINVESKKSNPFGEIVSVHSGEYNSIDIDTTIDDVILVCDDMNRSDSGPTTPLLDQMSLQMKKIVGAILNNGEDFDQMNIVIREECRRVSVVKTDADGNCLPSALAHQLYMHPIGSQAHIECTNSLRSSVVQHMLQPENIPRYRAAIEEHMKDINMEVNGKSKCEAFIRDVLSQPSRWMGLETLKAVSNMHEVTIIIFNEDGPCYAIRGDARYYDRTIMVAYRLGLGGDETLVYNHYDSVVDIDAYTLHDSAKFITKK